MLRIASSFALVGLAAVLSSGCALDSVDPAHEEGAEPAASIQQEIDPVTAAYVGSIALHNTVDSVDKIIGWFDDSSPSTGYDPRVDQIISELNVISYHLNELRARLDQLLYMLNELNYRLDAQARLDLKLELENRYSYSLTALDKVVQWKASGKTNAAALNDAMTYSSLGLNFFSDGPDGSVFYFVDHHGETKWDYRAAAPYYMFALAVRVSVLAVVYANATSIPTADATKLKDHATRLDTMAQRADAFVFGCDDLTLVVDNGYSTGNFATGNTVYHPPTKYTVGTLCVDTLTNTNLKVADYCTVEGWCQIHAADNEASWFAYASESSTENMRQIWALIFGVRARNQLGITYMSRMAEDLRGFANTKRLKRIPLAGSPSL